MAGRHRHHPGPRTRPRPDAGRETITLLNTTPIATDLTGWALGDTTGRRHTLSGTLNPGATLTVTLNATVQLANTGNTLILTDPAPQTIDRVCQSPETVEGSSMRFLWSLGPVP
jgi:hypothetical protein